VSYAVEGNQCHEVAWGTVLPGSHVSLADQIRRALNRIGQFLNRLARTAEQLSIEAVWAIILSVAFVKWLKGRVLHPLVEDDQMLLQLLA
jgi:hypothetical protein